MPSSFAKYKQCLRGNSFGTELDLLDLAPVDGRTSTVVLDPKKPLLPPQLEDKPTVVFDLDETLVYSRDGPLYVRPHFKRLLAFTCLFFETVVWTAGSQEYAELVCEHIDPDNKIIQHCIYRHDKWYKEEGPLRGQKDLRTLGRDMSKLIIIENNPDSIRGNSNNSILLEDYEGPVESDLSLIAVMEFLSGWLKSDVSIPEYLAISPLVQLRPVDSKDSFDAYHIDTRIIRAPLFEIDLIPRLKWMFSSIVGGYEEEKEESTNGDDSSAESDNKSSRTRNAKQSKTNKRKTKGRKTRLYRRKRVDNLPIVKSRVEYMLGFSLPANVAEILDAAGSLARLCAASLMISSF